MSDLSIKTALDSAVNQPRKAAPSEVTSSKGVGANASAGTAKVDVSNYVTSPKGIVDPQSGVYVLQYRDGATGEVINQYPSEKVVDAYKRGGTGGDTPAPTTSSDASTADASGFAAPSAPDSGGGTGTGDASVGTSVTVGSSSTHTTIDA